nr:MAG TPA: hypothetical protein [Caudoviricetes sp.]
MLRYISFLHFGLISFKGFQQFNVLYLEQLTLQWSYVRLTPASLS